MRPRQLPQGMDLLLLTVPAQHGARNPAVITETRRLRQWLESLPLDDAAASVPQLSAALEQLNALELGDAHRLKLLDQYHTLIDTLLFTCDEMGLDSMELDFAARQRLVDEVLAFFQTLANGYKIVVRGRFEQGALVARDANLLTAACRVMEVQALTLLYACRAHVPTPPMLFLELNQIYALGEAHGALSATVRMPGGERSIGGLFRQYALFAVSQQTSWEGTDLLHLYSFLERFSSACEIYPENSHEPVVGAYRIDLAEDQAPMPGEWQSLPSGRTHRRLLDVWPVINAMGAWVAEQGEDAGFAAEAELEFVHRLVAHLSEAGSEGGAGT